MVNLYSFEGITCTGCKNSVTEIYSKIDGVIKVSMSSDFKEVLIVCDKEIDMKLLQELVSYEKDYKVISY
jgi:copper chaperone CopZ